MLEYTYYDNLSPADKTLFQKCHTFHNELYHDVFQILKQKLLKIYIWQTTMKKLSVHELCMIRASLLAVALDLDIDFHDNPGLIDHKLFFPPISSHNQIKYSNSFLQ